MTTSSRPLPAQSDAKARRLLPKDVLGHAQMATILLQNGVKTEIATHLARIDEDTLEHALQVAWGLDIASYREAAARTRLLKAQRWNPHPGYAPLIRQALQPLHDRPAVVLPGATVGGNALTSALRMVGIPARKVLNAKLPEIPRGTTVIFGAFEHNPANGRARETAGPLGNLLRQVRSVGTVLETITPALANEIHDQIETIGGRVIVVGCRLAGVDRLPGHVWLSEHEVTTILPGLLFDTLDNVSGSPLRE